MRRRVPPSSGVVVTGCLRPRADRSHRLGCCAGDVAGLLICGDQAMQHMCHSRLMCCVQGVWVVEGVCHVLPAWLFTCPASGPSPPAIPSVRMCTPGGPLQPPLWSAQTGWSLIPGVREVGVQIESMWWWGCAPVSFCAPVAPTSLSPPFALFSPLSHALYLFSTCLTISPFHVSSILPRLMQAI
jgi:hypothetical protein